MITPVRGHEIRRRVRRDGQGERLGIQVGRGRPQDPRTRDADRVERDVDAVRLADDVPQIPVHSLLVEDVDLGHLGGAVGGHDVLGHRFNRCPVPPGEKEPGPLGRESACDSAADRASGSVDHRDLVLQHHRWFLSVPWAITRAHFVS
jgi:hypothetical protein